MPANRHQLQFLWQPLYEAVYGRRRPGLGRSSCSFGTMTDSAKTGLRPEGDPYGNAYTQLCGLDYWQYWVPTQSAQSGY